MTFSNIISKVNFLTKTNVTSFPLADLTILANNAMERVVSLIIRADNRWQWDDTTQPTTDAGDGTGGLPIATTALVANQQDYTFATTHLEISRVEIKDTSGNWKLLQPIDQHDIKTSLTDFMKTASQPVYYDKIGASIILYPKPDYSQSASLKVWFTRPPIYFVSSDTTKAPGFNILYHDLIPLWVSYDYAVANGLPNANQLMIEITRKEEELLNGYNDRSKDEQKIIKPVLRSSR